MIATERVQRLLEPGYATELEARSLDELRAMHEECAQAELALSYYRRLAQARMEILEAEQARRERGGSVGDLVADLPRILSAESGRSSIATTRGAPGGRSAHDRAPLARPSRAARGRHDAREAPGPPARRARVDARRRCAQFERELSDLRAQMHVVIDAIDHVIADRRVAGTAG